jgi:hypothetical protein
VHAPRTLRRTLLAPALCLAAALCAVPTPRLNAQSVHTEAMIRASQARFALRANDVDEAIRLFRQSLSLEPQPHVFRELATVLERQGRLREAAGAWTRYAALAPEVADQQQALEHRELLRHTPSLLTVRVTPVLAARSARVWFDRDAPRYVTAGGAQSLVEGGPHRVRVESPGYLPFEIMVPTAFGEPVGVVAAMRPDPAARTDAGADGP